MRITCIHAPWVCLGDFNEILHRWEKIGARPADFYRMTSFQDFLNDCSLLDLPSHGCAFTWSNHREGDALVKERLDRAVCNADWRVLFPHAQVLALPLRSSGIRILSVVQLFNPLGTLSQEKTPRSPTNFVQLLWTCPFGVVRGFLIIGIRHHSWSTS